MSEQATPDATALREGLRGSLSIFLDESDLRMAVGETGICRVNLEVFLERGKARHAKGAVYFERRLDLSRG